MTETQTCQLCEKRPAVAGAGICVDCSATLPELFTAMTGAIREFVMALAGAVDTPEFARAVEQVKKLREVFPVNVATGSETVRVRMDGLVPDDTLARLHSDCVIPRAYIEEMELERVQMGDGAIPPELMNPGPITGWRAGPITSWRAGDIERQVLRSFGVDPDHVSHPAATAADHIRAADLAIASELEIEAARGTPPVEPESQVIDYATSHDPDID